ncbi:MAG TPA: choice-of-anchor tandem repeat GloVer-containing protein [Stellaceae bacterium]|nr:choice-of-anchor tandem repeat GloVer-containing protein [Stellaceae bacterium]
MCKVLLALSAMFSLATIAAAAGQSRAADLKVLYDFCAEADCADGANPAAGLVADADGNLFGTTVNGGAYSEGTVFEIRKIGKGRYARADTILASFDGNDGKYPFAGLIIDAEGNLFGTTAGGGATNDGTVFEVLKTAGGYAGTPTVLVSFDNAGDGAYPQAGLAADADGNLFGTTFNGGAYGGGTVFEIAKTDAGYADTPIVLYSFCAQTLCTDGANPAAGLVADADSNLFGTTFSGGGPFGGGTVFEIVKSAGGYAAAPTTLVDFDYTDGMGSTAGLIADADGNLFGTTTGYGTTGPPNGTAFEIAETGNGYAAAPTVLTELRFAEPSAGLIMDKAGNLYGTTYSGGKKNVFDGVGTVFKITKTAGGYASLPTTLISFTRKRGKNPESTLIANNKGGLLGTTYAGGAHGLGTIFEVVGSGFVK